MAGKSVSFNANCNLNDSYLEDVAKWLSCNGEVWGVGPTLVFAAAAALFLHHEVQASVLVPGDHPHVTVLEKSLMSAMVVGTLALMVHIWVCLMRFFQYYLDTLIKDSPNVLLEMTTAGLLGSSQSEIAALGPLTRFLRQQQPQIHITVCWLLALCYADYIRKHYCTRFNMPYLDQWQADLHEVAGRRARGVLTAAHSFAAGVRTRLRLTPPTSDAHTRSRAPASESGSAAGGARGERGERGVCSQCSRGSETEVCVTDACAAASDDLQKIRAYIKATRCSCSAPAAKPCSNAAVPVPRQSSEPATSVHRASSGAASPAAGIFSGAATPVRQQFSCGALPVAPRSSCGAMPVPPRSRDGVSGATTPVPMQSSGTATPGAHGGDTRPPAGARACSLTVLNSQVAVQRRQSM